MFGEFMSELRRYFHFYLLTFVLIFHLFVYFLFSFLCSQVLSSLHSQVYSHLFALRTKHKNNDRTYYLAAKTDDDMNKWVDCLCQALGLKENQDGE